MSGINKLRAGIKRKSNSIRAKATNGTIKITYRLKNGDLFIPESEDGPMTDEKFSAWCVKRGLWKVVGREAYVMEFDPGHFWQLGMDVEPDGQYPFRADPLQNDGQDEFNPDLQFVGLVESGYKQGNITILHVSVRGILQVPLWWFTRQELLRLHHSIFGKIYQRRMGDDKLAKNTLNEVRDLHNNVDYPDSNQAVGKLVTVYFRT